MNASLDIATPAPDFDLPTDGGGQARLSDYAGQFLVLYFYPKDDTSGCTKQAIAFSGLQDEFKAAGASILGVSKDSAASHDKFVNKHSLSIRLASDESLAACEAYGVWVLKKLYGREYMGIRRSTFLIGPDGTIRQIWNKVKVAGHAEIVLEAIHSHTD